MSRRFLTITLATVALCGCASRTEWREVLYQSFQTGALSATVEIEAGSRWVPLGWESLPPPTDDAAARWTIARWDGGNDRRTVNRTYLVTNGNGLPGCWLTKVLAFEVGPDFDLQCVWVTLGGPAALTLRVVNDTGHGYEGTISLGVTEARNAIRRVSSAGVSPASISTPSLPGPERLQWYRPQLTLRGGTLILSLDGREITRARNVDPQTFTAVQFSSGQRVFLDDFEMWGTAHSR